MPLLIREMHIKVNLNAPAALKGGETGQMKSVGTSGDSKAGVANKETRESMVAECVEQVLETLNRKYEP